MTQSFEAWIVELIEGGDLSLPDRVAEYLHGHLMQHQASRSGVAAEHQRVVAYVEAHGPDTELCRKVVRRLRQPDISPHAGPDRDSR